MGVHSVSLAAAQQHTTAINSNSPDSLNQLFVRLTHIFISLYLFACFFFFEFVCSNLDLMLSAAAPNKPCVVDRCVVLCAGSVGPERSVLVVRWSSIHTTMHSSNSIRCISMYGPFSDSPGVYGFGYAEPNFRFRVRFLYLYSRRSLAVRSSSHPELLIVSLCVCC